MPWQPVRRLASDDGLTGTQPAIYGEDSAADIACPRTRQENDGICYIFGDCGFIYLRRLHQCAVVLCRLQGRRGHHLRRRVGRRCLCCNSRNAGHLLGLRESLLSPRRLSELEGGGLPDPGAAKVRIDSRSLFGPLWVISGHKHGHPFTSAYGGKADLIR